MPPRRFGGIVQGSPSGGTHMDGALGRYRRGWSVRRWLIVITAAVLLPIMGLLWLSARGRAREDGRRAEEASLQLAKLAAAQVPHVRPGALQEVLDSADVPPGITITVLDDRGTIVARIPDPLRWIGADARGAPIVDSALSRREGILRERGVDGVEWFYGFATVPGSTWRVYAGIPAEVALIEARRNARWTMMLAGAVTLITVFGVAAANRILGRPIAALARVTQLAQPGGRISLPDIGPAEVSEVAQRFNVVLEEWDRAQATVLDQLDRMRLIVSGTNIGMWDWDLASNRAHFSDEWKRQIGYEPSEIRDDFAEWEQRVHPDDLGPTMAAVRAYLGNPLAGGYEVEFRFRHKDGSYRWIHARGLALRDDQGTAYRMLGTHLDITDRKRVEEGLRERENILRLFVEHSPAAIAMFDRDMKYLVASRRWLTDYNLGDRQIIGRSHYEIFPEIPQRWKDVHQRCLAGAVERCEEDPFPRADGTTDWVRWEVHPWLRTDGTTGGIIIFSEVITERKQAELERARLLTAESQARTEAHTAQAELERILERVADGFVALDRDWRYTYVNAKAGEMFGRRPEDLIGKHIWTEFPEGVGQPFHLNYERAMAEQRPIMFEEYYAPWGRWYENRVYPSPDGVTIFFTDVTERHRAAELARKSEQAVRRSEKHLRDVMDSMFTLVAVMTPEGIVREVNRAALDSASAKPEDVLDQPAEDTYWWSYSPEARRQLRDGIARAARGELVRFDATARLGENRFTIVDLAISPVRDEDGRVTFLVASAVDITERVRAQNELRRFAGAAERAREAERARLAREVHDELGQALTGLKIDATWIQKHVGRASRQVRERLA
ncbi:MAG TPA: PAS domain S-box protein, partial [Gemmatimonadales bacterium]|nr:PAS domain S-box protein [Gemmatimonadales bacterium]